MHIQKLQPFDRPIHYSYGLKILTMIITWHSCFGFFWQMYLEMWWNLCWVYVKKW